MAVLDKFLREMAHFGDILNLGIDIKWGAKNPDLASFVPLCRKVCVDWIQPRLHSLILGNNVMDLEGSMGVLVEDILAHFSPTLEYLEFALTFCRDFSSTATRDPSVFTFPVLKSLKDSSNYYGGSYKAVELFYSNLLYPEGVPNLTILKINHPTYPLRQLGYQVLRAKLETLEIKEDVYQGLANVLTFPDWNLKNLSLSNVNNSAHCKKVLTEILVYMSHSLEQLTLESIEGSVTIPPCRKLERMTILFSLYQGDVCFEVVDYLPGICPRFEFDEEQVAMGTEGGYFPILEDLIVTILDGEGHPADFGDCPLWHEALSGMFPAGSEDIFRSLKRLKVPRRLEFVEEQFRARLPPQVEIIYEINQIENIDEEEW